MCVCVENFVDSPVRLCGATFVDNRCLLCDAQGREGESLPRGAREEQTSGQLPAAAGAARPAAQGGEAPFLETCPSLTL